VEIGAAKYDKLRSYAMNAYINWVTPDINNNDPNYYFFTKISDFAPVNPTKMFTFADTAPGFVCHAGFVVVMGLGNYYHYPAAHHDDGGTLSFADGHAEYKRWVEPGTIKEAQTVQWISSHLFFRSSNRDLYWLREHASVRK
jgi:prepilin-type processing-associated H-X9-DG protein